jgi:hypothetical protein
MSGELDWLGCPQCGRWAGHELGCPLAPDDELERNSDESAELFDEPEPPIAEPDPDSLHDRDR